MSDTTTDLNQLVDRQGLRRVLSSVVDPFTDMSLSLLSGGASNLTFLLTLDSARYVLRRRPLGPTAARAHDMKREFTVISALNQTDFPVPRAILFCGDKSVVGEPFYVMEFIDGSALHTPDDVTALDAAAADLCSRALIAALAALHAIDPAQVGLQDFGWPQNFLQRRITSWMRQWASVEHRDFPAVESLGLQLLARIPASSTTTLIHGDYRLGNVLFELAPSVRLVAVLDWEMFDDRRPADRPRSPAGLLGANPGPRHASLSGHRQASRLPRRAQHG